MKLTATPGLSFFASIHSVQLNDNRISKEWARGKQKQQTKQKKNACDPSLAAVQKIQKWVRTLTK